MDQTKILTVVGATGQQGESVVEFVGKHPGLTKEYKIRALVRDLPKASLPDNVEIVKGDLNDVESLKKAFSWSDTVFGVTNYWEKCDQEFEKQQGINIADAAVAAGVRHLIFSGSTTVARSTDGKIAHCEYFDNKAEVMEYIEQIKGPMVATYPTPAVFMQTIKSEMRRRPDGTLAWSKPWDERKTRVLLIDARDIGTWVAGIMLQSPEDVNGVKILGTAEWTSPRHILDELSAVLGEKVTFEEITAGEWYNSLPAKLPQSAKMALTDNMIWIRDYGYFGLGAEEVQKESLPFLSDFHLKSWKEFVTRSGVW